MTVDTLRFMSYSEWLPILTDVPTNNPNTVCHLMLVGETGSGKSFFANFVNSSREKSGSRTFILDPHAINPNKKSNGDWGKHAIGAGRDYEQISNQMDFFLAELSQRYEKRKDGEVIDFPDWSIFIDEWPAIKAHCDNATGFLKEIAREGRKVGIRLVVLTQSALVESLGIKGEGDTRENFSFVFLGSKARAIKPSLTSAYPAVLDYKSNRYELAPIGDDGSSNQGAVLSPVLPGNDSGHALEPDVNPLKLARAERNLTLRELSEISGISVMSLTFLENGKRLARFNTLVQIATALEKPLQNFLPLLDTTPASRGQLGGKARVANVKIQDSMG